MLPVSRGSKSCGRVSVWNSAAGAGSHRQSRSPGHTSCCLCKSICGHDFASLHRCLYVFLRIRNGLFFPPTLRVRPTGRPLWKASNRSRSTFSHCSRGPENPVCPFYSDRPNMRFSWILQNLSRALARQTICFPLESSSCTEEGLHLARQKSSCLLRSWAAQENITGIFFILMPNLENSISAFISQL